MRIQNNGVNVNSASFSGHTKHLGAEGQVGHRFYYLYDPDEYKCFLELYNIKEDEKGNISIKGGKKEIILPPEGYSIAIKKSSALGFAYRFRLEDKKNPSAKPSYAFDNGDVINISDKENMNNKYNIVFNNRALINKNGPMQLIMPDEYYPGIQKGSDGNPELNSSLRSQALFNVRTHANKLGGNFYGIMERLPKLKEEGISRIVGTPFTKDTVSSHKYWTENAYQVSPEFGTEADFKELQRRLFSNGINWVADAALVNEGLNGVHLAAMLRKGNKSYANKMFKSSGGQKVLGILPAPSDNDETIKHTKMKIINYPYGNKRYDKTKPTYIQFYDDRLASERQINSESPSDMKTYEYKNTFDNPKYKKFGSVYDITKHDDAVYPFAFEVEPDKLRRNLNAVKNKYNITDLKAIPYEAIEKITDFENSFKIGVKSSAAGLELWDGNVDIAKLNFYDPSLGRDPATLAVKDYAVNSGRYWSRLTADTQQEFIVDELKNIKNKDANGYYNKMIQLANAGVFPQSVKDISKNVIQNVLDGKYHLRKLESADLRNMLNPDIEEYEEYRGTGRAKYYIDEYIFKKTMEVPLETLPVADNLMSVLTSPYIVQKPLDEDEIGVSKYDLAKRHEEDYWQYDGDEDRDKVYPYFTTNDNMTKLIYGKIVDVVKDLTDDIKGIKDNEGNVTDFGRYVLSEITPDITRYLLLVALDRTVDTQLSDDGHLNIENINPEEITMQSIGINPYDDKSDKEEAKILFNHIYDNLDFYIDNEEEIKYLKEKINKRLKNKTLNDYKIAEMIHDRTESGLGWRIDAAKDVASMDSVRTYNSMEEKTEVMTKEWDNVIDFWKRYNQAILEENPHAYTTAEITDLASLLGRDDDNRYKYPADAERKFIEQTGITSVANYNYFYSLLPRFYTPYSLEDGSYDGFEGAWMSREENPSKLREKLVEGWAYKNNGEGDDNPGFLFQSPEDGITNSYTFIGNHDKPRILHGLALDMSLFHHEYLSNSEVRNARARNDNDALNRDNEMKARTAKVLMKPQSSIDFQKVNSKAIAMGERINNAVEDITNNPKAVEMFKKAVSNLAQGTHKGKKFDAEAFGTRPIEVAIRTVIDEAEYQQNINFTNREIVEAKLLKSIIQPAFERFKSIYKLLNVLPGSPTDFAGDRVGATGFETKAKNYFQQNRNVINWEWLENPNYDFVRTFYDDMNKIAQLRTRPELSALNDGTTVSIPIVKGKDENGNYENSNKLQALLRYNDKGSIVLALHSNTGASTPYTKEPDRKEIGTEVNNSIINRIVLNPPSAGVKEGLKHGLKDGLVFKNAANLGKSPNDPSYDKSKYKINKSGNNYILKRFNGILGETPITIKPEDLNTLILYSDGVSIDK